MTQYRIQTSALLTLIRVFDAPKEPYISAKGHHFAINILPQTHLSTLDLCKAIPHSKKALYIRQRALFRHEHSLTNTTSLDIGKGMRRSKRALHILQKSPTYSPKSTILPWIFSHKPTLAPLTFASVIAAFDIDIFFSISAGAGPVKSKKNISFFLPPFLFALV